MKKICLLACLAFNLTRHPGSLNAQTSAPGFNVPPGFVVTEYADQSLANDIYCMTVDNRGRIVVAGRGYIRILVDDTGAGRANRAIEFAAEPKDGAMGLLWEGDSLLVMGDGGLRRLVDKNGDGKADGPSELLRAFKTGGEHTGHALCRGPDGWLYVLCGNVTGINKSFVSLPTSPVKEPVAGCVLRLSPDYKHSEIVAHGYRNPYGMDFNLEGDLFTFDSDNERCVSLPWYEPTRLYHVMDGGFYGWLAPQRADFWRLPPYFIDVEPPVATLGRGSPTGVACYRHTQFPEEYRGGLFLCDWTFGRVHFAELERKGASYTAKTRVFLESTGDNGFAPTAALVHPKTGDLFIAIGGRGTRGAVYRVRYTKGFRQGLIALPIKKRSLEWNREFLQVAKSPNASAPDRLRALDMINRYPDRCRLATRWQAFLVNSNNDDRALRQACVVLLRQLYSSTEVVKHLKNRVLPPRSLLCVAHAYAPSDPALSLGLLAEIAGDPSKDVRLECLRILQIALSDIGAALARGTLWEGYSLRGPAPDADRVRQARQIALDTLKPGISPEIRQEVIRTAGLLALDQETIKPLLLADKDYQPPTLVHDLACLALAPGKRGEADTTRIANLLVNLDRLAVLGKWNRDHNWPTRIAELYQGLALKDPSLPAAVLAHTDFGRPDHVLFTQVKGLDRRKAAALFLAKIAADKDYPLNPAIVKLLDALPAGEVLAVLRPRWGSTGVESALLPLLARQPEPTDRPRFLAGLEANQPATFKISLEALEKLPGMDDGSEALALIRGLGQVSEKQKELKSSLETRLAKITGQKLAGKESWTTWFTKTHPDKAARLTNPDGVDVDAWAKRLGRLEWTKGQPGLGNKVFIKASCINCHSGSQAIGPDLVGVAGRFSRADLFTAIIQPSRDVPARYQTTVVETADGKIYQGLVIYDAVDSLILQTGPATTVRMPGEAVSSRRVSPLSLMPPGLLDRLDDQEIVNLYAYLQSLRVSRTR